MLNEFRQDLVSGEWVLFATERAKRPLNGENKENSNDYKYASKENCPFEDFQKSGNESLWFYPDNVNWNVAVIKNKFPAVKRGACKPMTTLGFFNIQEAVGYHDLFVYKDHDKTLADFSNDEFVNIIRAYKKRYKEMAELEGCVKYILIFHNYGREAGASIYHPHSQIISLPILPPDVAKSLNGSIEFYKKNEKRVYDVLLNWELKENKRVIYENDLFIAFCPFVSKYPYEVRIFPRDSHAHFEQLPDAFDKYLADAMRVVLNKIKKALNNPPYNFFIHTASVDEDPDSKFHEFYTWHIEILPKIKINAGFEMGTGIDINVVDPDYAAKLLRETNV
jgi:UDPglucose--hexose-1-phosphate uridylyltransferase